MIVLPDRLLTDSTIAVYGLLHTAAANQHTPMNYDVKKAPDVDDASLRQRLLLDASC